ncbi:MAG TPA: AAA family ATPase [Vicinamibacterales bacterium]|nr:AAA family ATPase [Vicinamibacterales bacterium]
MTLQRGPRPVTLETNTNTVYTFEHFTHVLGDVTTEPDNKAFKIPEVIPPGNRHETVYKLLRSLKARNTSLAVALTACHALNAEQCQPPLEHDELDEYLRRVWNQANSPEFTEQLDDTQQDDRLLKAAMARERAQREARRRLDAEERPPRPPLQSLTLGELFARLQPKSVVDQWIPDLGLVQVVGKPGALKTFFVCHVGLCIAAGKRDVFGYRVVQHGPVLYIAAEGGGAFQFRVRAFCNEHDVDPLKLPFHVIPIPVDLRDPTFQRELLDVISKLRPVLVIVDTLSRCTPGADENSARDMGEVVSFCSKLQNTSSCAIAFVHHPPKGDPKGGGRGSGVIFGAVDAEIRIDSKDEDEDGDVLGTREITVTCVKQKDDLRPPPLELIAHVVNVCNEDGFEMVHDSGRPITSLVLRPADAGHAQERAQARAAKVAAEERITDIKVLTVIRDNDVTGRDALRQFVAMQTNAVSASLGRLMRAQWVDSYKKRGEPYKLTPLGLKQLEVPF